ncbi:16S rRNA (guanine(966)-N(2))-methyltransferase RsmD [candidate division KSB1 bacterium]|nr:16S rRNA (guanine(966)-N(2))-methyltransferase RsmD [candidate division KSB1 bacterium]
MRVISGSRKGRVLRLPRTKSIRPTTDRTKEFIFNYIGEWIKESFVLDLFAGSGNLGIEALSRGASNSVFVDIDRNHCKVIKKNLELTNLTSLSKIVVSDVFKYLNSISGKKQKFDVIFADPPYLSNYHVKILEIFNEVDILYDEGILILEHSSRLNLSNEMDLQLMKHKKMGDTSISIYKK